MISEKVEKSIQINAPREKVWHVLLDDKYTRIWYSEFCEGSYAETDWTPGSKALFKDGSGNGLVSKIVENRPAELISIEHQGVIAEGKEDLESPDAKKWKGSTETYRLSEKDGKTDLSIECDIPPEYNESFSEMWEGALKKIKELSETQEKRP